MTPGTRRLMREGASWAVVALIGVAALMHLDTLRSGTEQLLGLPPSGQESAPQHGAGEVATAHLGSLVEIKAGRHGHFHAEVEINGRPTRVMIDTGASAVALTYEDAERAGLYVNDSDFRQTVSTANGTTRVAPVTLDRVSIGDISVRDVPAVVTRPGLLNTTLLGMTFLSRLSRFDMRSGVLILQD
jgi:aspartyl protease family protein